MRAGILARRACLALLACGLTACDAGSRAPGSDNNWPGPELTVVQPGPGQVVRLPIDGPAQTDADGKPRTNDEGEVAHVLRWRMPTVLVDVRRPAPRDAHEGDRLMWRLDGGAMSEVSVAEAKRGFQIDDKGHPAGTHVLQIVLVNKDGVPYANPQACATRVFHLRGAQGDLDRFDPEGDEPLVAFDPHAPLLLVMPGTDTVSVAVGGRGLGDNDHRIAYRVDGKEPWRTTTSAGTLDLGGVAAGPHTVDVKLERYDADRERWVQTLRPRGAYEADAEGKKLVAKDAPIPGEMNFARVQITTK